MILQRKTILNVRPGHRHICSIADIGILDIYILYHRYWDIRYICSNIAIEILDMYAL